MEKICCVYQIKNIKNGKCYVGSTINYVRRRRQHASDMKCHNHYSKLMQSDYDEYGLSYFSFSIVENVSADNLEEREQYWIDELHPEYNTSRFARKPDDLLVRTDEARKKISEAVKKLWLNPEYREKCSIPRNWKNGIPNRRGAKLSDETKEKLRQANLGKNSPNWGVPRSEKAKLRTSIANAHTYEGAVSPEGVVYSPIINMSKFCKEHGLGLSGMVALMHGRIQYHKGWTRV